MKRGWLFWTIVVNLLVLVGLVFAYPHLMVAPGPLVAGHTQLTTDCFACHTAWHGATAQKCITCHALPDIGMRTTKGEPLPQRGLKTSFHQQLSQQDCMACHSDHAGPKLTKTSRKPFSHALLRPAARQDCATCHTKPDNEMHSALTVGCGQCHHPEAWKPATFEHSSLAKDELARCESCHKAPTDKMHAQMKGNCAQCHTPNAWKPATFEHSKFFELDGDHNASCVTCHVGNDNSRYTCYGCHEHTPSNIRSKHEEEGINDLKNCVRCHRSANGEGEGGGGERGKGRGGGERD